MAIERRQFISALGGAVAAWPLPARSQQAAKLPTIGFLGADASEGRSWIAAFVGRLRELGWIEGRTVAIEYRWGEASHERNAEIAAEFVRQKVDVIVSSEQAVATVMQATSVIPIVFPMANDPVGAGLVASLSRPGGNVTGMSNEATDLAGKRLELLREAVPHLRRLAIMADIGFPQTLLELDQVKAAAHTLGFEVVAPIEIRRAEDITSALAAFKPQADALYVVGDALLSANQKSITTFALGARLPAISNSRNFVQADGLISYGPSFTDQWRRAAEYVDKILRGMKPAELPVQQPTKFHLAINLRTAKTLGLTLPPSVLAIADEVIE